jgi:hypothetical protein
MPSIAGFGDVFLLPRYCSDTAVEFGGELYTFVDVDRTLHGVSGGDQRRRSLQARGLKRGFLFVGQDNLQQMLQRERALIRYKLVMRDKGYSTVYWTEGGVSTRAMRRSDRRRHQKVRSQAVDGANRRTGNLLTAFIAVSLGGDGIQLPVLDRDQSAIRLLTASPNWCDLDWISCRKLERLKRRRFRLH